LSSHAVCFGLRHQAIGGGFAPLGGCVDIAGAGARCHPADCLIVAGTSLSVYPAAGFIRYFQGDYFVLINRDPTPADKLADLVLHQKVGQVLSQIQVR
jgi:NAD-dependent deacetylase